MIYLITDVLKYDHSYYLLFNDAIFLITDDLICVISYYFLSYDYDISYLLCFKL